MCLRYGRFLVRLYRGRCAWGMAVFLVRLYRGRCAWGMAVFLSVCIEEDVPEVWPFSLSVYIEEDVPEVWLFSCLYNYTPAGGRCAWGMAVFLSVCIAIHLLEEDVPEVWLFSCPSVYLIRLLRTNIKQITTCTTYLYLISKFYIVQMCISKFGIKFVNIAHEL